ncbi:MAG: ABC transporter substrate-binding protein [Armatimonadetes bacterium]|nr:ABC transporter substrate-binding protein [Armatimonadota bacterium]
MLPVLATLAVGLLAGAGLAQRADDTIVVAMEAEIPNLDPAQLLGLHSIRAIRLVTETLVAPKPTTTEIVPLLATSWTVSADGLQWTFKLRPNVRFHDGTPFTAEAVKYTFDRVIDKNHPAYGLGKWSFLVAYLAPLRTVEVVDSLTVRLHLKYPNSALLEYLALPNAGIISPTAQQKLGKDLASQPVGTGPYTFKAWQRGVKLTLERNDAYWGTKGKAKSIIFRGIPEDQTRVAELLAGNVDVIIPVHPDALAQVESNRNTALIRQRGLTFWYVALNIQKAPFNDVRIRQALNYAVNKEAIVRDVLKGTGIVATQPVPPSSWGFAPDAPSYPYNPQKARQLLAEAMYPNGFPATFWVPDSGSGMQLPKEMSTVIQANLAAVGIQAKIEIFEWGSYLGRLRGEKPDMAALSWFLKTDDPDVALYPVVHSQAVPLPNRSGYSNPEVDRLLLAARATADRAKRAEAYKQVIRIVNREIPWIAVDHQMEIVGVRRSVRGVTMNPNGFYLGVETAYHQ